MTATRAPFALHAALSPFFTTRWLRLALDRLEHRDARPRPVTPAVFPRGTGAVRIGGATAAQPDGVTCAATGLLLLNAAYDPALAGWLEHGELPDGGATPPEIARLTSAELATTEPGGRLRLAAAAVHRRATARTLGPFGWPRAIGTPPWGVAREARVPGVRYAHRAVDDRDDAVMDLVLDVVVRATRAGYPVPLYSGGDRSRGWQTAMPRHLVLALPSSSGATGPLRVYEPGSGRIRTIEPAELRARTVPHPALGGWPHLAWVLVPLVR